MCLAACNAVQSIYEYSPDQYTHCDRFVHDTKVRSAPTWLVYTVFRQVKSSGTCIVKLGRNIVRSHIDCSYSYI